MRISIHAPHGARRADMANYQVIFFEFQSTHHTGRDDICAVKLIFVYAFQSTHHTGRDSTSTLSCQYGPISIHAPHGRDTIIHCSI